MADLFLIISMIVAFVILVVVGVYLLIYYQHPDDHNDAYFPKLVVIGGFVLAGATVLLLPLDVANREGYAGTKTKSVGTGVCIAFCVRVRNSHRKCIIPFPAIPSSPTSLSWLYRLCGIRYLLVWWVTHGLFVEYRLLVDPAVDLHTDPLCDVLLRSR